MKSAKKNILKKISEWFIRFYYKNKPVDKRDWIRLAILAIAIPVFIYSSWQLIYKVYTYIRDDIEMQGVVDDKKDNEKNPFDSIGDNAATTDDKLPYKVIVGEDSYLNADGILKDYETLWQRNNDLIGWINFPGFSYKPINYPIVYSGDNSYYLRRDYDGVDSVAGSIFLDGSNTPYSSSNEVFDRNYVFYGHAMGNKSMFGNITDYWTNEKSWKNHTIYIDFLNTRLEYEVFSTFVCDPYYNYRQTHFSSDEEYKQYLDTMLAKSTHDFGQTVGVDDRIITLSTCYKHSRRCAVVAKLVRQIVYRKSSHGNIDIDVTPIVLPTYMPFKVPTITPKPSPGASPSVSPTAGVTGTPASPLNLLTDPGIEDGSASEWGTNEGQAVSAQKSGARSGQYAALLSNSTQSQSMAYRDVTEILLQYGPGRYAAEAYLKSGEADTSACMILQLTLADKAVSSGSSSAAENSGTSEAQSSDTLSGTASSGEVSSGVAESSSGTSSEAPADPQPATETVYYYSAASVINSKSWTAVGSKKAYLQTAESVPTISWEGKTLVSAILVIAADAGNPIDFYFDDVGFYKEGVNVTPTPAPTKTTSSAAPSSAEGSSQESSQPSESQSGGSSETSSETSSAAGSDSSSALPSSDVSSFESSSGTSAGVSSDTLSADRYFSGLSHLVSLKIIRRKGISGIEPWL